MATNLFGTQRRVELALGAKPEALLSQLLALPEELFPLSPGRLWRQRRSLRRLLAVGAKSTGRPQNLRTLDQPPGLSRLPLLTTWPEDGGAFITLPLVYTRHPETGISNLGMYRMQRFDDETTGFHCQIQKGAGFHLAAAKHPLPVNVFIGGPPAVTLAAVAPLPENIPELLLASLLFGRRIRLAKNPLGELPLLDAAEFALVGTVDPQERRPEGPFGDHYGYYSLQHEYPVFRCRGLLRRKDPICTATVVGKPRQEDFFLGNYLQLLLAPLFPYVMPGVRGLWSYGETGYHALAAARVEQRYKREAMAAAFRILGEGQLSLTKFLLVVDGAVDLHDIRAVLEHVLERADFAGDLYIFSNLAMDTLDYTGPAVNEGSKGVLLGVGAARRSLPAQIPAELPSGIGAAAVFCKGCLVVSGPSYRAEPGLPRRLLLQPDLHEWPLIVIVDDAEDSCRTPSQFLWSVFTRFEPAADVHARRQTIVRNHITCQPPIVFDARMKPSYPAELECDAATEALVSRRWSEYFAAAARK